MKFSKLFFTLLAVSAMIPAFAACRGGSCHRGGHSRRVSAVAIVRCKGGSCRRGTQHRTAPKMGMKKAFASCRGGVCKLYRR